MTVNPYWGMPLPPHGPSGDPGTPAPARRGLSRFELRGAWAIITWVVLATILLVPFTNVYLPGADRKYSVMSILWLVLLICLVLAPSFLERGWSSILAWMLLLFVIRYVYGWLLSRFPEFMDDSTRQMTRPLLWAWILAAVMREERLRWLGTNLFVIGSTLGATLHLMGIGVGREFGSSGMARTSAFELNANVLGVIYGTAFIMCLARMIQPRRGLGITPRALFALAGIANLAGLSATGSRTAGVFIIVGSLTLFMLEMRRARWSIPAILAVTCLVGAIWGVAAQQTVISERTATLREEGLKSEDRVRMMPVLIEQFSRSPIYGLGPENYRVELGRRSQTGDPGVGIVAHNQLLMFAVEMGIFGLIPFISTCVLLLLHSWKVRHLEGGLPLALSLPCVVTAWVTSNVAFHWHFHFIVAYVAASFGAMKFSHPPVATDLETR
ncbi:MAG TPA: O-antigen ligase family protein [Holophagaceae bacterium]|nr:O-antigen ligase family protein [Holophagaceae bacterium]